MENLIPTWNFLKVFLQLILALCNVNFGGNKGVEGGKSILYLLGINQIQRMINKCRVLLQYFKNSVNNLPPSFLSQSQCKGLNLASWLRIASRLSKYINLACNEEHGYISAMMMNFGARGGWILNALCIELPMQPLLVSISEWLNLIKGPLLERRVLGFELGSCFFFQAEQLSRLLNLFASKMGCLMTISLYLPPRNM